MIVSLCASNTGSKRLIETMRDSYWLLNLVENDFTDGDIFGIFRKLGVLDDSNGRSSAD